MWKLSSHTVIEYWLNISCVYTFHVLHDVLLLKDSSMCGMSQLKTALVCQIMFWVVICIIIVLSSRLLRPVQPSNNYSIELPHKLSKTVHCLWNIADKTAALFRNCPATHTHTHTQHFLLIDPFRLPGDSLLSISTGYMDNPHVNYYQQMAENKTCHSRLYTMKNICSRASEWRRLQFTCLHLSGWMSC